MLHSSTERFMMKSSSVLAVPLGCSLKASLFDSKCFFLIIIFIFVNKVFSYSYLFFSFIFNFFLNGGGGGQVLIL